MVAGPNGSGKTTLIRFLRPEWVGYYLNADNIERQIKRDGHFDFLQLPIQIDPEDCLNCLQQSKFLADAGLVRLTHIVCEYPSRLNFSAVYTHEKFSYVISVMAEFIRTKLLGSVVSFTFETVMSHPGKVNFLRDAKLQGWRTYLYYIATGDPEVNVGRVHQRVQELGHYVPEEKIRERYTRSLSQLSVAASLADRVYVFDNSGIAARLLVEINNDAEQPCAYVKSHAEDAPWVHQWLLTKLPVGMRIEPSME